MGKPINVEVKPRDKNESFERLVRRFSKKVKKEKIVENYRDRRFYEKPSVRRARARKRRRKLLEKLRIEREKSF